MHASRRHLLPSSSVRKILRSANGKTRFSEGSARAGLPASYTDSVNAWRDQSVAGRIDRAQVTRREGEANLLHGSRLKMNSLECPERAVRSTRQAWKAQIQFGDLIALTVTPILHIGLYNQRSAGVQRAAGELQAPVREL